MDAARHLVFTLAAHVPSRNDFSGAALRANGSRHILCILLLMRAGWSRLMRIRHCAWSSVA